MSLSKLEKLFIERYTYLLEGQKSQESSASNLERTVSKHIGLKILKALHKLGVDTIRVFGRFDNLYALSFDPSSILVYLDIRTSFQHQNILLFQNLRVYMFLRKKNL